MASSAEPGTILQERRNIIVLGKTGAGKSTVANTILGQEVFPVSTSVQSVTRRIRRGEAKFTAHNVEYNVKLIDTVGLFDTGAVTNTTTIEEIKTFFREKVTEGVHLVLFVFKEGRFTPEERDTFDFIIKKFSREISEISALVITNCELKSEKARQAIESEFRDVPTTKHIADFVKQGIYVVGFPKIEDIEEEFRPMMEQKVEADKNKLKMLVQSCDSEPKLAKEIFKDSFWDKCCVL